MSATEFSYGSANPEMIMHAIAGVDGVDEIHLNRGEAIVTVIGTFVPREVIVEVWKETKKTMVMRGDNASETNEAAKQEISEAANLETDEARSSAPTRSAPRRRNAPKRRNEPTCGCFGF